MQKVIIAAMAENRVIGKDGNIPWHLPEDLKHFKEVTTGYPIVMGRKTYFSLPESFRPLPDRKNVVLTRSSPSLPEEVEVANSFEEAWKIASETGKDKVFIIGGASIYEQSMEDADKMVLTFVHGKYDGDTYFPEWNEEEWKEAERDDREELSFVTLVRKN